MMSQGYRAHWLRRAVAISTGLGLASIPAVVIAACAVSDETGSPDTDAHTVIPLDGPKDGGSIDAGGPAVPCASGSLCRAPTPLTLGAITSIHGRSKNDVWASGTGGLLMHWNGHQWSTLESNINDTLSSIVVTSDETWGISGTLVLRRGLDPKSVRTSRITYGRSFSGIVVLSNQDAYVGLAPGFGETVIYGGCFAKLDFDLGKVALQPDAVHPSTGTVQAFGARALFVVPDKAIWLVGDGAGVVRYPVSSTGDGGSSLPGDAGGEGGPPVGDAGGLSVGQGVLVPVASQADLFAAWAYDDHLWAAGRNGTILHFDGAEWHIEESGTTATINAIFGLSPKDIWAAGDDGTVLRYDGNEWLPVEVGTYSGRLTAIWGAATDDVWIGGEGGMFHWGAIP